MPYIFYGFTFHRLKDCKQFTHLPDEPVSRTCIDILCILNLLKLQTIVLQSIFTLSGFGFFFAPPPTPDNFCSSYRFQNKNDKAIEKKDFKK